MDLGKKPRLHFKDITLPESPANAPDLVRSIDLYTLDNHGTFKVAEGPSPSELERELEAFNHAFYCYGEKSVSEYGALSLLYLVLARRCDERITPEVSHRSLPGTLAVQDTIRARSRASSIRSGTSKIQHCNPIDLKELRKFFDRCRKSDFEEDFGLSLIQREPHCHWSCTRHSPQPDIVNCVKFSYSLVLPDGPALIVSHHFHSFLISQDEVVRKNLFQICVNGDPHASILKLTSPGENANLVPPLSGPEKEEGDSEQQASNSADKPQIAIEGSLKATFPEMARGFTIGLNSEDLQAILLKASSFEVIGGRKRQPKPSTTFRPMLHPKAILLGVLEAFESELKSSITSHQNFIKDQEDEIKVQRTPENKNGDGLARCSTYLSETNVKIGLLRPKAQYLMASLTALESCKGIPESVGDLVFLFPTATAADGVVSRLKNPFEEHWMPQLNDINARLWDLKGKCDHCKADLETLQHRVTGNLLMLSNILAQRENDWIHETEKQRSDTTNYQIEMLKKQEVILLNQEIIAKRAKLDGTVTKWIAILTAALLPGTFIAILFTVPIFNWDAPDEVWVKSKPFKLYWKVTGSMTGAFVAGFSLWFLALELWDRRCKPDSGAEEGGAAAGRENGGAGATGRRKEKSTFKVRFLRRKRSTSHELLVIHP